MSAPDLPPPPPHEVGDRPLWVHLTPGWCDRAALAGATVVMIDQLRASTTMAAALWHGAAAIRVCLSVEEAFRVRSVLVAEGGSALLGGERGGRVVDGFDLGNSPTAYTAERVAGRTIVFTTTNGTAALLHARGAARVLVGCLANASATIDACAAVGGAVHLLCAGTRDEVSLDDVVAAGAIAEGLLARGWLAAADDSALLALDAWRDAGRMGVVSALLRGRGGRNLERIGARADVEACAEVDRWPIAAAFDAERGVVERVAGARG